MITIGIFVLLGIAIGAHYLLKRFVPLIVPKARLKVVAAAWLGAFAATLVEQLLGPWEPRLAGTYLLAGLAGATLVIVGLGLSPFVAIMLGLKLKRPRKLVARQNGQS